jgi:hypothetical protein
LRGRETTDSSWPTSKFESPLPYPSGTRPLDLGGRAFDVLMALIEASGAGVSKAVLMNRLWPDRIVEENSLQPRSRRCAGPSPPTAT